MSALLRKPIPKPFRAASRYSTTCTASGVKPATRGMPEFCVSVPRDPYGEWKHMGKRMGRDTPVQAGVAYSAMLAAA